jgi:hypothetical protein
MHSWDVVNEQVETWEANIDGIRVTPWLTMLGYDYMDLVFRTAYAADPNALLVYNRHLACSMYHRLAARRGKKRAILAVAHAIVVSAFHRLSRNEPYRQLGANYFDEHRRHQLVDRLARRIERLGYQINLQSVTAA